MRGANVPGGECSDLLYVCVIYRDEEQEDRGGWINQGQRQELVAAG